MITAPLACEVVANRAKSSGSASPSLPAEMTITAPALMARTKAACKLGAAAPPPRLRLITRAPAATAASTAVVRSVSANRHSVAHEPGVSARRATTLASKATPCAPMSLRTAAMMPAALVPWPSESFTVGMVRATTSVLNGLMLPTRSA